MFWNANSNPFMLPPTTQAPTEPAVRTQTFPTNAPVPPVTPVTATPGNTAPPLYPNFGGGAMPSSPWPGYYLPQMGNQYNPFMSGNQPINPVGDVLNPNTPAAPPQAAPTGTPYAVNYQEQARRMNDPMFTGDESQTAFVDPWKLQYEHQQAGGTQAAWDDMMSGGNPFNLLYR